MNILEKMGMVGIVPVVVLERPEDAVPAARALLDGGIDFDVYQQWAKNYPYDGHEETTQALSDYWSEMQAAQEQAPTSQEIGGMTLG